MKAILMRRTGGPEVLEPADIEVPSPRASEVRVRVKACALNHLDLWVRGGLPRLKYQFPHILGSDIAGVIDAVGADVASWWKPGAEVVVCPGVACGSCPACASGRDDLCGAYGILGEQRPGGNAEYICVPARNLAPKPTRLTFAEAAAAPLVFLTAWHMLIERARLRPGETVLVHAAGSGVGMAAIQIAKLWGATVYTTAGSDAKLARARELGADHGINYKTHDFLDEVKQLTDRRGVDVVVEHTGAETWDRSVLSLVWGGRLVTCGATSGYDAKIDLRQVYFKRLSLLGSTMGSLGEFHEVIRHIGAGKLRPIVDRTFPLAEIRGAHEHLASRANFGKVVLEV